MQRAILAGHSMNLLGLRGQAKTRIARGLTDAARRMGARDWRAHPLPEDPLGTRSRPQGRADRRGARAMKRPSAGCTASDRYVEKLATPDVSVADLIGDIDPIKAANEGPRLQRPPGLALRPHSAQPPLHFRHQ